MGMYDISNFPYFFPSEKKGYYSIITLVYTILEASDFISVYDNIVIDITMISQL